MPYLTLQSVLNSASANNPIVIVSTVDGSTLVIDDLQAIINLTSNQIANFQGEVAKVLELSIRNTQSNLITTLLQFPIYRKQLAYSENLLSYLTFKQRFILQPFREIRLQVVGATNQLSGADYVSIIGQAATVDTASEPAVIQNFVTATYSVPARENLLNPVMSNNWRNDTVSPIKYYKDQINRVHLTGFGSRIDNAINQTTMFNLPVGYRPLATEVFSIVSNGLTPVPAIITITGDVTCSVANTFSVGLSAISFLAA